MPAQGTPQSVPLLDESAIDVDPPNTPLRLPKGPMSLTEEERIELRNAARVRYGALLYLLVFSAMGIITFVLAISSNTTVLSSHNYLERVLPTIVRAEHMAEAFRLFEASERNRFIQFHDLMCFNTGLQCGLIQETFQSSGRGIAQLLKVCAEVELRCATTVYQEIVTSDLSKFREGLCYGMANETKEEYLFCISQQNLLFPSIELTGLLPQSTSSMENRGVAFNSGLQQRMDGNQGHPNSVPIFSPRDSLFPAISFYSNPQLGPMYLNLEKTLVETNLYGLFISYTYNTKWNRDTIANTIGGGGSQLTPDKILPSDGAAYVSLSTSSSTYLDGSPGSFGRVTTVLESSVFDGLGKLYVDNQIVVLSGKDAIVAWEIGDGLSSAISRPTITKTMLSAATAVGAGSNARSLISPSAVHSYIEKTTGKRKFMVAMHDRIHPAAPDDLLCNTIEDSPSTCGGFITIDRDTWQSSPTSSISRFTPDGLNNGLAMPTPGEFVLVRERNLMIASSSLSKLHLGQDSCAILHAFIVQVLNQSATISPPPIYDYEFEFAIIESAKMSFYNYDTGNYLFNISTLWLDSGDILKTSPRESGHDDPATGVVIEDSNHLHDPNLQVSLLWKQNTGYAPSLIRKANTASGGASMPLYYGVDFFTGGIFSVMGTDPSGITWSSIGRSFIDPWKISYVAWLPYIVLGEEYDRVLDATTTVIPLLPMATDMTLTSDGKFLFVSGYGLGQVFVYTRKNLDGPRLHYCTTVQVTVGQYNHTRVPPKYHPARPGVPLHGGPGSLTVDPTNRFLYVTTGDELDDCVYPSAAIHGNVLIRYTINSFTCSAQTLVLDPAFIVTSFDLPVNIANNPAITPAHASAARTLPARFGSIRFPVGDDGADLINSGTAG
jgi:hypothetical protein